MPTFAEDFKALMDKWDEVTARVRAEHPDWTDEQVHVAVSDIFTTFWCRK